MVDVLMHHAAAHAGRDVYRFLQDGEIDAGALTYGELDRKAKAVAVWLGARCRPGERVLLFCPSSLEFMIGFFGCLYAGLIAVPVHTPDPARVRRTLSKLRLIVRDARPGAVLTNNSILERIDIEACEEWGVPFAGWKAVETIADEEAANWRRPDIDASTLAFLQYTSGSTGDPKGVMVSHGNIVANEEMIRRRMHVGEDTPMVSWLPLYHDMGIIGPMLQTFYVGSHTVFMSPMAFLQKPYRWLKAISDYRAVVSGGPNFAYDLCARRISEEQKSTLDLSGWRVAFNGAEPVRKDTLDRFAQAFASCGFERRSWLACYGMAEATLLVTGTPIGAGVDSCVVSRAELQRHRVREAGAEDRSCAIASCGSPDEHLVVRVVDPETRRAVGRDEVGEIWISGPNVAQGYWKRPEVTHEIFEARIEGEETGPYLRTGDLGFLRNELLYVTGRRKEVVIVRGHNYYPQDIEQTVERSHAAWQPGGCAALSVEAGGEERLVIVAEVRREWLRKLPMDELVRGLQRNLSIDFGLSLYGLVVLRPGSLLKTTSGKIQRTLISEQYLQGTLDGVVHSWTEADDLAVTSPDKVRDAEAGEAAASSAVVETGAAPAVTAAGGRSAGEIREWLIGAVARALRQPRERVDPTEPLSHGGLDSLNLVSLTGELSEWLGVPVPPSVVFDYPSIDALARHFAGARDLSTAPATGVGAAGVSAAAVPIAVVGMSCRFPGANNVEAFWRLVVEGRDAVGEVPHGRWDIDSVYDPLLSRPGTTNSRWGGFIEGIEEFDPLFFGVSPLEVPSMDPQQRLLMMTAWEALESAAIAPASLARTSGGVVVGISSADYSRIAVRDFEGIGGFNVTGCTFSIAANRLSFFLDMHGPSLAVDAACASSLAAVQLACQYLRSGASDLMLAGAVNAMLVPESMIAIAQAGLLSPDGRCRTFDEGANGYVRGEGCGVLVLKRLSDAVRDGDPVIGVIREVGINHNGLSNGLKAPSGRAQQQAITRAIAAAGLSPADIGYVEAHGTGTLMGDAIELATIRDVFSRQQAEQGVCYIGSVKTNIGHGESVSGMAGLIKTLLMLRHGWIPPHLHVRTPNRSVPLDGTGVQIARAGTLWPRGAQPRRAGVSSFGFGGVNCFAVLEEAPERAPETTEITAPAAGPRVLTLSASTPAALDDLAQRHAAFLSDSDTDLADACHTSQVGRSHFRHRLAVVAESRAEMAALLGDVAAAAAAGSAARAEAALEPPRLAFLFSGQGAQYENMGRQLYESQPLFRSAMQRCADVLEPLLDVPLLDVIYPKNGTSGLIHQTRYTQPALFALEYSLYCLWRSWGVQPAIVIGHSIGEFVAACVAGAFSLEDGLRLVARRAALMQSLPDSGAMAAVFATDPTVREIVAGAGCEAEIACVNSPRSVVISGPAPAVEAAIAAARGRRIHTERLRVSHAFHSRLMEPMLEPFGKVLSEVGYERPTLPLVSNLTGALLDGTPLSPDYFIRQARQPVLFADGLRAIEAAGVTHFLEVGPKATLLGMGQATLRDHGAQAFTWLPSLREDRDEVRQMLETAAALYVRGVPIAWSNLQSGEKRRRVSLPTYPFQCQRYWWDSAPAAANPPDGTPLMQAISSGDTARLAEALAATGALPDLDRIQVESIASAVVAAHQRDKERASLRDWMLKPTLRQSPHRESAPLRRGSGARRAKHLIVADRRGVGARLAAALEAKGHSCRVIADLYDAQAAPSASVDARFQELFSDALRDEAPGTIASVVFLSGLDLDADDAEDGRSLVSRQLAALLRLQHVVKSLVALSQAAPLWVVCDAMDSPRGVVQSPLSGFVKTLALEHPDLFGGFIGLATETERVLDACAEEIAHPGRERWIVLADQGRFVPRLTRVKAVAGVPPALEGAHVITGGFGDLGVRVARWLARRGAQRLVFVSRGGPKTPEARKLVEDLARDGVQVADVTGDIADGEVVDRLRSALDASTVPVRGVFHCAGVIQDGLLVRQGALQMEAALLPKVAGAWNLHRAIGDRPLEVFALFGSVASVLGSPGQANYAAANAYLEALAQGLRNVGRPVRCLSWGPWKGAGMMGRLGAELQDRLVALGLQPIEPELGIACLEQALALQEPQLMLAPIAWEAAAQSLGGTHLGPFLEEFVAAVPPSAPAERTRADVPSMAAELRALPSRERRHRLVRYLQDSIGGALKYPEGVLPDAGRGFFSMGLDSLMLVNLLRRIEAALGVPLSPAVGFENPTINEMAGHLCELLAPPPERDAAPEDVSGEGRGGEDLAHRIDELSEEEALELLDHKIASITEELVS